MWGCFFQVYAGLRQPDFNAPPELEGNSMAEVQGGCVVLPFFDATY